MGTSASSSAPTAGYVAGIRAAQLGILGLHTTQDRPIAVAGKVEIRPMMYIALSHDHRIIDGQQAVLFLVRVKELMEEPASMLVS